MPPNKRLSKLRKSRSLRYVLPIQTSPVHFVNVPHVDIETVLISISNPEIFFLFAFFFQRELVLRLVFLCVNCMY